MGMLKINWGSIGTAGDAVASTLSRLVYFWPFSWRSANALILGVLLAKWFWILFAPHATFTAATPERAAEHEAGKLFGVVVTTESVTQGGALPNVKLLGVFTGSVGRSGFAVLKVDERQTGVAEGEEVAGGAKLISVHADHVMLERAGVQYKIMLEDKYAGSQNRGILPAYGAAAANKQVDNVLQSKAVQDRLRQLHR